MIRTTITGLAIACLTSAAFAAPSALTGNPVGCPAPVDFCDAGCWDLGNKVTGQVAPPNYGLRLDGLFGAATDHWTFDFEAPGTGVQMCYDGNGTITVDGVAFGGLDVGGAWDPQTTGFLEIHMVWENAACVNGDLLVLESNGGIGHGSVEWLNTGEVIALSGKANASGQVFLFDGHTGDPARGWVMYNGMRVGDFAMTVTPSTDCPPEPDCDDDGVPDTQEVDCNGNGIPDDCEDLADCDQNGTPDVCDIAAGAPDVNGNGVPDVCEPDVEIYCVPDPQRPEGGTVVPCPCGNVVLPGATSGCANSTGFGASLTTNGTTSVAAGDLELAVSGLPVNEPGIFITGNLRDSQGTPFRSGLLCIGGPLVRLEKVPASPGGFGTMPAPGHPSVAQQVGALPGDTFYFQFWYRDGAGPCGGQANLSNALRVTFGL